MWFLNTLHVICLFYNSLYRHSEDTTRVQGWNMDLEEPFIQCPKAMGRRGGLVPKLMSRADFGG